MVTFQNRDTTCALCGAKLYRHATDDHVSHYSCDATFAADMERLAANLAVGAALTKAFSLGSDAQWNWSIDDVNADTWRRFALFRSRLELESKP